MTLVEILLATFILVSVLLPIGGLIFGGLRGSESSKSFNVGANMAANVMDQLISAEVPFRAIDTQGGPTVDEIVAMSGFTDATRTNSDKEALISSAGSVKTAGFKSEFADLETKIFGALGAPENCSDKIRCIYDKGYVYEVYWFAGIYKDENSDGAKYKEELTFSFFKNPYVPVDSGEVTNVVLSDSSKAPYTAVKEEISDPVFGEIVDPKDPRSRPGWPDLGGSDTDWEEKPTYEFVSEKAEQGMPAGINLDFPLVFTDLDEFNEADGGLMKMIVGIRWGPKTGMRRKGTGSQQRSHEFWLVSMKGRIEEG